MNRPTAAVQAATGELSGAGVTAWRREARRAGRAEHSGSAQHLRDWLGELREVVQHVEWYEFVALGVADGECKAKHPG